MELQRKLIIVGMSESLSRVIATYIRGRREISFAEIPGLPGEWRQLAVDQDVIGWDNFMEGKLSNELRNVVRLKMLTLESYVTAEDWTKS